MLFSTGYDLLIPILVNEDASYDSEDVAYDPEDISATEWELIDEAVDEDFSTFNDV
jgi:hypothetical protein